MFKHGCFGCFLLLIFCLQGCAISSRFIIVKNKWENVESVPLEGIETRLEINCSR